MQLAAKACICLDLLKEYLEIGSQEDTTEMKELKILSLNTVRMGISHPERGELFLLERHFFLRCSMNLMGSVQSYPGVLPGFAILGTTKSCGGIPQPWELDAGQAFSTEEPAFV